MEEERMGTPSKPVTGIPRALTIAGSDSGGGAGIQADLKVFLALGCHGMSAVTALTAQNTVGVSGIHAVPPDFVVAQIDAIATDIGVDSAKTGMLANREIVSATAEAIRANNIPNVVVDPVFVAKSRDHLLEANAVTALREEVLPLATVITPNLYEAGGLLGAEEIRDLTEMREAAQALHKLGPEAVLVKGGHLPGDRAVDVLYDGKTIAELDGPRFDTEDTHGTGCALSAAIAARLARGDSVLDAVRYAKDFVSGAIQHGLRIGKGYGPVNPAWQVWSN
jgi:hydroxymethylpyrimidine/phosphomethylpyrimidine kinase